MYLKKIILDYQCTDILGLKITIIEIVPLSTILNQELYQLGESKKKVKARKWDIKVIMNRIQELPIEILVST